MRSKEHLKDIQRGLTQTLKDLMQKKREIQSKFALLSQHYSNAEIKILLTLESLIRQKGY